MSLSSLSSLSFLLVNAAIRCGAAVFCLLGFWPCLLVATSSCCGAAFLFPPNSILSMSAFMAVTSAISVLRDLHSSPKEPVAGGALTQFRPQKSGFLITSRGRGDYCRWRQSLSQSQSLCDHGSNTMKISSGPKATMGRGAGGNKSRTGNQSSQSCSTRERR